MNLKKYYNCVFFRECWNMLNHRKWTDDHYKVHFESGVRLGAGSFNLVKFIIIYLEMSKRKEQIFR